MFRKLKNKRNSAEWDSWFLKYTPGENSAKNKKTKTKTKKNIEPSIKETNFWEDSETPQSKKSTPETEPSDTKKSTTRSAMRKQGTIASRKSGKKNLSFSENVDEYLF
jgi:hypothetical protein